MAATSRPKPQHVPQWAQYQKQAYGTTYEPLAIVYNKRLLPADEVPQTPRRSDQAAATQADKFKGKVTTYDIEKSGVGFILSTQDARVIRRLRGTWSKAHGRRRSELQSSTGAMMERICSGENLIGFNIFGSYAVARQEGSVDRLSSIRRTTRW